MIRSLSYFPLVRLPCVIRRRTALRRTASPRLRPLQLLLAACVRFSCCSRARLRHCCSPFASSRLQLLLPDCARFSCCSPDCVRFGCCSPIAYWIPAHARRPGPMFSNIRFLCGVRGSVNKLKFEGRASL